MKNCTDLVPILTELYCIVLHIGRNIYYSSTYMQYLRDYRARISLPISYLVTD